MDPFCSHALNVEVHLLGKVAFDRRSVQVNAAKSDVAIGTQQIERWLRNLRPDQFLVVCSIGRNRMDAQKVSKIVQRSRFGCGLPDQQQVESSVVEMLEQVLGQTVRQQLEPHPREAIARGRCALRQARQRP